MMKGHGETQSRCSKNLNASQQVHDSQITAPVQNACPISSSKDLSYRALCQPGCRTLWSVVTGLNSQARMRMEIRSCRTGAPVISIGGHGTPQRCALDSRLLHDW